MGAVATTPGIEKANVDGDDAKEHEEKRSEVFYHDGEDAIKEVLPVGTIYEEKYVEIAAVTDELAGHAASATI